jgi:hypothetical protein
MKKVLGVIALVGLLVTLSIAFSTQTSENTDSIIPTALALEQPDAELLATSAFPKEVAGISAYVKVSQQINVTDPTVLDAFVNRPTQLGKNYVIGVVRVDNNGKAVDVNLYADSSGWIVAYFGKATPTAAIVNWKSDINETILHSAIQKFCNHAGINYDKIKGNIKFYHFAKPNADKILIFANYIYGPAGNGVEKRTYIFIPNSYSVNVYGKPDLLEVSYSLFCYKDWDDEVVLRMDGNNVRCLEGDDRLTWATLSMAMNAPHKLSLVVTDPLDEGDWAGMAVVMLLDEV